MIRRILIAIGVSMGVVALFAVSTSAQSSGMSLGQTIRLIDCTATAISNGSGTSLSTECEGVIAPTVDPQTTDNRRPTITGTFDASTMHELRVTIAGRTYVLGTDSELTVEDNRWRLDLSGRATPLDEGVYDVIAEAITVDGLLLRDGSTRDLVIRVDHGSGTPGAPDSPTNPKTPGAPDSGFKRLSHTFFLIGAAVFVVGIGWATWYVVRKKRS